MPYFKQMAIYQLISFTLFVMLWKMESRTKILKYYNSWGVRLSIWRGIIALCFHKKCIVMVVLAKPEGHQPGPAFFKLKYFQILTIRGQGCTFIVSLL